MTPNSRSYLNRWTSPDSIITNPYDPQDWDRYNFVRNNPLKYIDPDGHNPLLIIALIGAFIFFSQIPSDQYQADPANQGNPYVMGVGAALMFAPALGPALCLNDGDCTDEVGAAGQVPQVGQNAGQAARGIWNLNPFDRGIAIENLLGRSPQLTQNFPVIDRFQNGVATSIKSIDLFAKSYQNLATLSRTVQGYVNTLATWQGTGPQGWGGTVITNAMIRTRELVLAIPPNASQAQLLELQRLQAWAQTVNVTLTIKVVP